MEILKISQQNLKRVIETAIEAIKQGKVIVCPTDTVYGLLADATNKKAVERLFKIKKRPKGKAVPIFVKDLKMAREIAVVRKSQEKFLKKIWPGKVTIILKKRAKIKIFGIDQKTIGLRIPNYKLVNLLLGKLNRPMIGTSANISGEPASTKIQEVIAQFAKRSIKPDLVIDASNLSLSKPSVVMDLTGREKKIIRQ